MKIDLFIKQSFYLCLTALFLIAFRLNVENLFGTNVFFSWFWSIQESYLLDFLIIVTVWIYTSLAINNCELQSPSKTTSFLIIIILGIYSYERFISHYFYFIPFKLSELGNSWLHITYFDLIYWVSLLHFGQYFKYLIIKKLAQNNNTLLEDTPIKLNSEDELNGLFSIPTEKICKIITENKFDSSFTIGVNSEWGDGKTSIFNLVKNNLIHKKDLLIVDFNPWIGYDKKVLIKDFFSSLEESLGFNFYNDFSKYTALILKGSEHKYLNIIYSLFGKKEDSLLSIFNEINEKIGRLNKKIIVFIDDVDRLDKEEVFEILKLIRKTANFKNTFFVLAYDRTYVNNSIKDQSGAATVKYLDKIINVEIALPYYEKYALKEYFIEKLKKVLPLKLHYKVDYIHQKNNELYDLGLGFEENDLFEYWLNNFREIKKIVNSISVNYYNIYSQVNFKDLLLLEILKLKHPQLYNYLFVKRNEILSVNRALFCYYQTPLDKVKDSKERFLEFLDKRYKESSDSHAEKRTIVTVLDYYLEQYVEINKINNIEKERITDLLNRLFIKWDENKVINEDVSHDPEQDLRVRFVNKFERYFSHTIFKNNISEEEFEIFLNLPSLKILERLSMWIDEGKLKDLGFRLNRNFQFKTAVDYKNTINISIKLLEMEKTVINFSQLINKIFGLKLYPDIFEDKNSASTYFKDIFSSENKNLLLRAQLLNELRKRNNRRSEDNNGENFPLRNVEIDSLLSSYIKERIDQNSDFNNEFWSLYFICQKINKNGNIQPFEPINLLLHDKLKKDKNIIPFLKSLIIYEGYGYESVIRKGAIENLFGSMEEFEYNFLNVIAENIYITEFKKYYTESKRNNWSHIEFDYEFTKQSISK